MNTYSRWLLVALLAALSGGCTLAGDVRQWPALPPMEMPLQEQAKAENGAIYIPNQGLNLYGDRRAHRVGDLLTINLIENTAARTSANTAISRKSNVGVSAPTIFGAPVTHNGQKVLDISAGSEHDFSGKGNSAQSNQLQGSVTVTVIQRLPNGNLVVQGQKNLRLNRGSELVQIQGIVRQADIAPDNTIASNRVAEARMVYGGRGALAQSNAMGWLGRFFNSGLAPY